MHLSQKKELINLCSMNENKKLFMIKQPGNSNYQNPKDMHIDSMVIGS